MICRRLKVSVSHRIESSFRISGSQFAPASTMWGGDRLSVLPDDLLLRILHFAPVNEAASTSALSKRWRGLWCSAGAVNLVARIPERTCKFGVDDDISFFSRRDAFVSGARSALEAAAAAGSPVTRLTFCVEASHDWRFL